MADFFPELHLSEGAAEAIARGLYAVAKIDGVHEREAALVASFWADIGGGANALAELERAPTIRPAELAAALQTPEARKMFLKTALLLAWADGKVSDGERGVLADFSKGLGVDGKQLGQLEDGV